MYVGPCVCIRGARTLRVVANGFTALIGRMRVEERFSGTIGAELMLLLIVISMSYTGVNDCCVTVALSMRSMRYDLDSPVSTFRAERMMFPSCVCFSA